MGAIESAYLIQQASRLLAGQQQPTVTPSQLDLSEQQALDCVSPNSTSNSCAGGWAESVMDWSIQFRVALEQDYPYVARKSCE